MRGPALALRAFEERGPYAQSRRLAARIDVLLGEGPEPLDPGGAWSARVLADIDAFERAVREAWHALVLHMRRGMWDRSRLATADRRFAGRVLRQHQFAAPCREREWRDMLQGDHEDEVEDQLERRRSPVRLIG